MQKSIRLFRSFALLLLVLLLGAATQQIVQAQNDVSFPAEPPTAATGLELFADRCANCHGPQGEGDGEMAGQLPAPPRSFVDETFLNEAVPVDLVRTITNGNLQRGMPPFGPVSSNPIATENQWDLVAAIYQLGTSQPSVAMGGQLFAALDDASDLAIFPDPILWYNNSNQTAYDQLQALRPELTEIELWALVNYGRSTSFASGVTAPAAPAAAAGPISGLLFGQVTNGTTGEPQGGLEALVRAFDPNTFSVAEVYSTTVAADGTYELEVVDVPQEWVYMATVNLDGIAFSSDIARLSESLPEAVLDLTVFEQTTDSSIVSVEQLHIIMEVVDNQLVVNELFTFSNNSAEVYVGETGDLEAGTIRVPLPSEAQAPSFQRGFGSLDSFVPADELFASGDGWRDTVPLRPGRGVLNLLASYSVPYDNGMELVLPIAYDTRVTTIIMPDAGVRLEGDWQMSETVESQGEPFLQYVGNELAAGEELVLAFTGRPRVIAPSERDSNTELIIGAIVLVTVLGAAVLIGFRVRQRAFEREEEDREALLQELAELDEAYGRGDLDEATYHEERQAIKDELLSIWE
jgi:mono/diheme cytochrome c family protein